MSRPTIAPTPTMPTRRPSQRRRPSRARSALNVTISAPTSGTAAIRSPVSELVNFVSAWPSKYQGSATSIAV